MSARRIIGSCALILVSIGLLVLVLLTEALKIFRSGKNDFRAPSKANQRNVSLVIPTWNGRALVERCLVSLQKDFKKTKVTPEVIVVDNGSSDGTVSYLKEKHPWVKILALPRNYGFAVAVNMGIRKAAGDIVILLNNDMVVEKGFLRTLLEPFDDPLVFAVTSQIFFEDPSKRREETGRTFARFNHGYTWLGHSVAKSSSFGPALYAGGGSSAYSRKMLLELGCFDQMYRPFYVEDVDISYRAWRRGWKTLYQPKSVVHHRHQATIGTRFSPKFVSDVKWKNQLLFQWKNLGPKKMLEHCIFLPALVVREIIPVNAVKMALRQVRECMRERLNEKVRRAISDDEILRITASSFYYRERYERAPTLKKGEKKRILFVCPYVPSRGQHGGATCMFEVVRCLSRRNRICVLAIAHSENEVKLADGLRSFGVDVKVLTLWPSYSIRSLMINKLSGFDNFYDQRMSNLLLDTLDQDFHIVQYEMSQMAQYLIKSKRIRTVLVIHELNFVRERMNLKWARSLQKLRALLKWMSVLDIELAATRTFDRIVVMSDRERDELLEFSPEARVDVIGIGVDTRYFKPMPEIIEKESSILCSGWFGHPPNVDAVLFFCEEVLPLVKRSIPDVKLEIVGGGAPMSVRALSNMPNVNVRGYVEDLRPAIAESSIYVCPVITGSGVRVKVLEAWSMGKAVVSTPLGCQGLHAIDGWNVAIGNNPEEFAGKAVQLLRDKALRRRMGKNARVTVKTRYDSKIVAAQHEKLHDQLWNG